MVVLAIKLANVFTLTSLSLSMRCYHLLGVTKRGRSMEKSEYGKWIHAAFTGASFAYFLAVIDKVDLIISSVFLFWATIFFAQALILNSIWAVAHHGFDAEINSLLKKHSMFRRFSSLSQWLFIFAVIALVLHVFVPIMKAFLLQSS